MGCPEPETLAQLAEAGGDPETRAALADHAASCSVCHAALLAMIDVSAAMRDVAQLTSPLAETVPEPGTRLSGTRLPTGGDPERVDRYIIKRRLGAGGMGVVYEATDPELGRNIALKMLRRGAPAGRLRREAQALARLDHRNVVTVYDVGDHHGQVFIAMALVDGHNLRQWLAEERTFEAVRDVLLAAGRGIAAAHEAGLVHRDLKPDNIFVASDGDVLVGDFGLARDKGDTRDDASDPAIPATPLTMTGMVIGTPAYMAPEQAEGFATERSDQFSFCVTAYEAFYGVRPFAGDTFEQLLTNARSSTFTPPERGRKLPARIDRALRRGLAADPAQRHPSMAALLSALTPPTRRWIRYAVPAAAAIGATAIAVVALRAGETSGPDCSTAGVKLASVWTPARHEAVRGALQQRGAQPQAATELTQRLDDYASRSIDLRRDTCASEGRITVEQTAARTACLDARDGELDKVARRIEVDRETSALIEWERIASMLPIEVCRDDASARLWVGDAAHQQLMRDLIAQLDPATANTSVLEPLRLRAEAAGDEAALLQIEMNMGSLLIGAGALAASEEHLQRALRLAEKLGITRERTRTLAQLARATCKQQRFNEASSLLAMADGALSRDGATADAVADEVGRAHAVCLWQQRSPQAIPLLKELIQRSVMRHGADSPEQLELHSLLSQAYYLTNQFEDGRREFDAFDRIAARFVSPQNAAAKDEEEIADRAMRSADFDMAVEHQRRAIELYPSGSDERIGAISMLAVYYELSTAWQLAAATHAQVVELVPADASPDNLALRAESLLQGGVMAANLHDYEKASTLFERAATAARAVGRTDFAMDADLGIGRMAVERKDYVRAIRILQKAVATYAAYPQASAYKLGLGQFALARALWETNDHPAAIALAKQAEAAIAHGVDDAKANPMGVHMIPVREAELARVAAWRDTHR